MSYAGAIPNIKYAYSYAPPTPPRRLEIAVASASDTEFLRRSLRTFAPSHDGAERGEFFVEALVPAVGAVVRRREWSE